MSYTIESWIDEMNILKSDKMARKRTAKSLDRKLGDFFIRQLADLIEGAFLFSVSSEKYRDELTDIYMMYSDSANDEWMQNKSRRFANQVQDSTENAVREVSGKPEFTQAVLFGIPMKKSDVPKRVIDALSQDRATRIAMNEANIIHNYKRHMELVKTQLTHTWDATLDEVTRPHHWAADGMTVPVDEPFVIAGEKMMFPGDDSLGATAKNLINCRCVEL
jgi:hypothetical protein